MLLRRPIHWLLLSMLLGVAVHTPSAQAKDAPPTTAEAFQQQLERVRRALNRGSCKQGKKLLATLVAANEKKPYVLARAVEIKDLMRQLTFGVEHPAPKPKDLIAGKLIRYTKLSSSIKVEYTPETIKKDWEKAGPFWVHEAGVSGPFTLTVKGDRWPAPGRGNPAVYFGGQDHPETGRAQSWIFLLGSKDRWREGEYERWYPHVHLFRDGEDEEELDTSKSYSKVGKFEFELKVERTKIRVKINKTRYGPYPKHADVFGQLGVDFQWFDKLTLEGRIEPSWIQAKIDKHLADKRKDFDRKFKYEDHLPAWLLSGAQSTADSNLPEIRPYPPEITPLQTLQHAMVFGLLVSHQALAARERMEEMSDEQLRKSSRHFLEALDLVFQGKSREAIEVCKKSRGADPAWRLPTLLQAIAYDLSKDAVGAKRTIDELRKTHQVDDGLFFVVAVNLLRGGHFDAAQAVSRHAARIGLQTEPITRFANVMLKATRGPSWSKFYEHKTRHYHVFSDIDQKTASETGRLLERMYGHYERKLERDERGMEVRRFPVYLFRGQQGFLAYIRDLQFLGGGARADQAAGLYDPFLKQLLIWNLPQRDEMLKTVRHEGLHQYLDVRLPEAPVWFNEGLAVYFEHSTIHRARIDSGQVNGYGVRVLREKGLIPLAKFMARDHRAFYADADHSYAQAWLFIHMLREGSKADKALFDEIWKAIESDSPHRALAELLPPKRLAALDKQLRRYLTNESFR